MKSTLFILLLSVAGCIHHQTDPVGSSHPAGADTVGIFGKWRWVKSTGGIAGMTIYPVNGNYTYYQFTLDSILSVDQRRDTEFVKWSTRFSITNGHSFVTGGLAQFLHLTDSTHSTMPQSVWLRGNDTLTLVEEVADGFDHLFVRRN